MKPETIIALARIFHELDPTLARTTRALRVATERYITEAEMQRVMAPVRPESRLAHANLLDAALFAQGLAMSLEALSKTIKE